MTDEGDSLRAALRDVARVKQAAAEEDARRLRATPIAERVAAVVRLSAQTLRAFPPKDDAPDDEAEVWARVQRKMRALAAAGRA